MDIFANDISLIKNIAFLLCKIIFAIFYWKISVLSLPTASPEFMMMEEVWNIAKRDLLVLRAYPKIIFLYVIMQQDNYTNPR